MHSIEEIGYYAFSGCSSLEQIAIPSSIKKIGERVFEGWPSLLKISIPSEIDIDNIGINSSFHVKRI